MSALDVIRRVEMLGGHLVLDGKALRLQADKELPGQVVADVSQEKAAIMVALGAPIDTVIGAVLEEIRPELPPALRRLTGRQAAHHGELVHHRSLAEGSREDAARPMMESFYCSRPKKRHPTLEKEYEGDDGLLSLYMKKLPIKGWSGKMTCAEKEYVLRVTPWRRRAAEPRTRALQG